MTDGLPGKPDYGYTRSFDSLHLEFGASTTNQFETVFSRGLLHGTTVQWSLSRTIALHSTQRCWGKGILARWIGARPSGASLEFRCLMRRAL